MVEYIIKQEEETTRKDYCLEESAFWEAQEFIEMRVMKSFIVYSQGFQL